MTSEAVLGNDYRADRDPIADFCEQVLGSLSRSDQRRWGELYVRGLVTVPGRKSIRKISALAGGAASDQSLQQFVNQSPWEWAPVRAELAHLLASSTPVEAWVAAEVAFPKNGQNSVGVCQQYAGPAARTLNCQLAMTLSLAGVGFCAPVNWRLMLPKPWDLDAGRRSRAHVPAPERHRPCWQHVLGVVDEAVREWGLAPRPVLADRRHDPAAGELVRGLAARGLRYLVSVGADAPVPVGGETVRAADAQHTPRGERVSLIAPAPAPAPGTGRAVPAHYVAMPLASAEPGSAGRPAQTRWLVSRRLAGRVTGLWLTDLGHDLTAVSRMALLLDRSRRHHAAFERGCGLHHFEGRSFRGWHHHVTLASAAHAYRLLSGAPGLVPAPRPAPRLAF
jgi:SRSO17 transposase